MTAAAGIGRVSRGVEGGAGRGMAQELAESEGSSCVKVAMHRLSLCV